jgi:hypothetical protein
MAVENNPEEERVYARWLDWGSRLGLVTLVGTFVVYVLGLLAPVVPVEELPRLWTLPLDRFLQETGAPSGWAWLSKVGHGDYLGLVGVAILCLTTLVCYARLSIVLVRHGERLAAAIVFAQILVLLAAASGFLAGGGH